MPRTLAIGDIHGCALALERLLEFAAPQSEDTVITLGDYVDRGSDSRRVLDILLELEAHCDLIPLLGNHDQMMMLAIQGRAINQLWLSCGGQETLSSYGGGINEVPDAHVEFLESCRKFHENDSHIFVHANYDPELPLSEQSENLLLWEHINQVPRPHSSGKTVIVGHTPQTSGLCLHLGHVICIDTFCFGSGCLTALEVDTGDIWQVNKRGIRCEP